METIEKSARIISKGVYIDFDYTKSKNTTNMLITANGDYNHKLELELEEGYIYFTWTCNWKEDCIVDINVGQKIKANISSFKDFLSEYFPILSYDAAEYDINTDDSYALKEVIIIMDQVFKFNPNEH